MVKEILFFAGEEEEKYWTTVRSSQARKKADNKPWFGFLLSICKEFSILGFVKNFISLPLGEEEEDLAEDLEAGLEAEEGEETEGEGDSTRSLINFFGF